MKSVCSNRFRHLWENLLVSLASRPLPLGILRKCPHFLFSEAHLGEFVFAKVAQMHAGVSRKYFGLEENAVWGFKEK